MPLNNVAHSLGLLWSRVTTRKPAEPTLITDPERCAEILACQGYGSQTMSADDKQGSRAYPNQRLVRAFGIDNAFTTYRDDYRQEVKRKVAGMLNTVQDWTYIAAVANRLVMQSIEDMDEQGGRGSLNELVQTVSLKVALRVFFGLDPFGHPLGMDDRVVKQIAASINHRWVGSKEEHWVDEAGLEELRELFAQIGLRWTTARDNPLNLVLPAYETLWRVVVRCFLEVKFRPSANPEWQLLLRSFIERPTKQEFHHPTKARPTYPSTEIAGAVRVPRASTVGGSTTEMSAACLVNEALRLYPPTKRIYRNLELELYGGPKALAVDIEQCHRLERVWGADQQDFRPERWQSASRAMNGAFMPFGGGIFECPAKARFGPIMIGLLVAALVTNVSAQDWVLVHECHRTECCDCGGDCNKQLKEGRPLLSERTSYSCMMLQRK
ncbi:MAG: hypothetical protein L6R40_003482 [Gallowayella cf. fulva]|nr:MAG: hypothetical protein L6R40_003482 [Xanthomendoza cf. fulva]